MNIRDVICCVLAIFFFNFVYELPDDNIDVPKHVEEVKRYRMSLLLHRAL